MKSKVNHGKRRFANVEEGDYQNFEFTRAWQLGREGSVTECFRKGLAVQESRLPEEQNQDRPEGAVFQCSQESWSWMGLNQVKTE